MIGFDADVAVVGGGPAGSATAIALARAGVDVVLLEKARHPREKPCAEYFTPGVVDALERLGVMPAVSALVHTRPEGIRISTRQQSHMVNYPDATAPRRALGVRRSDLDRALFEHAATAGATARQATRVSGVTLDEGGATLRLISPDGEVMLRTRLVVGADGLSSTVARSLGLDRTARWPRRLGLIARFDVSDPTERHAEMHVEPSRYCGIAPVGGGVLNVGLVVPMGVRAAESTTSYFDRQVGEMEGPRRSLRGARRFTPVRGIGPLHRRVSRPSGAGYLLVGDAAGFLDPFTGEGVYRALRGAELAAPAVLRALGRADRVPVGYAAERRAIFGTKERLCWLVQAFLASPRAFDHVVARLARRPSAAAALAGALGDYGPAAPLLGPAYLWSLLRP